MTNNNSDEILLIEPKATGGVFRLPVGSSKAITTASANLPSGATGLGLVSEDGLTVTIDEEDATKVLDWAKKLQRTKAGARSVSAKFSFIQISVDACKAMFGDNAVTVSGQTVTIRILSTPAPACFVFDMADGDKGVRVVLAKASASVKGDISFVAGDPVAFEVELSAGTDSDGEDAKVLLTTPAPAGGGV